MTEFFQNSNLVVIVVIMAVVVLMGIVIVSRLFPDDSAARKEKLKAKASKQLRMADKLMTDGYSDQAIIQAYKALEQVMKGLLKQPQMNGFDAIKKFQSQGKFSKSDLNKVHSLRKARNEAAHAQLNISSASARVMLSDSKALINKLLK